MVRKQWMCAMAVLLSVFLFTPPVYASTGPTEPVIVYVNDVPLAPSVPVVMEESRILVGLRGLFEALGREVHYDTGSKRVLVNGDGDRQGIVIGLGEKEALVGGRVVPLDVPARVVEGRTLVPLRFAVEALGGQVAWEGVTNTVSISIAAGISDAGEQDRWHAHEDEVELLARIIYAEAGSEPFQGQVAVGAVVVNRVEDPRFPDSIEAVIKEPGQFLAVYSRRFQVEPSELSRKAALTALSGYDPTGGALFFYNPRLSTSSFWRTKKVTAEIGNHNFAR